MLWTKSNCRNPSLFISLSLSLSLNQLFVSLSPPVYVRACEVSRDYLDPDQIWPESQYVAWPNFWHPVQTLDISCQVNILIFAQEKLFCNNFESISFEIVIWGFIFFVTCLQQVHCTILCLVRKSNISKFGHGVEVRACYPTKHLIRTWCCLRSPMRVSAGPSRSRRSAFGSRTPTPHQGS